MAPDKHLEESPSTNRSQLKRQRTMNKKKVLIDTTHHLIDENIEAMKESKISQTLFRKFTNILISLILFMSLFQPFFELDSYY